MIIRKAFAATVALLGVLVGAGFMGAGTALKAQTPTALSLYLDTDSSWPKNEANELNNGVGLGSGADGLLKWHFQTNNSIYSSPVLDSTGNVYFGSNDGNVYSVDSAGNFRWSFRMPISSQSSDGIAVQNSLLVGQGVVYVGGLDGYVCALNSTTGAPLWSKRVAQGFYSSPSIGPNGLIYIQDTNGVLYALNSRTGDLIWTFNYGTALGYPGSNEMAIDPIRGTIYAVFYTATPNSSTPQTSLVAVNPDGRLEWVLPGGFGSPVIGPNGWIYCCSAPVYSGQAYLSAIQDEQDGTFSVEWRVDANTDDPPSYLGYFNGQLYASGYDFLSGISASTGATLWTFYSGAVMLGPGAIASDGTLYADTAFGLLFAVDGATGKERWEVELPPDSTNYDVLSSPAVGADGTVYMGWYDGKLYAIGQAQLRDVQLGTDTIIGGYTDTGSVDLTGTVGNLDSMGGPGADIVTLASSEPSVLTVPATVAVPTGSTGATFQIATSTVSAIQTVTVTATLGSSVMTATMFVTPSPLYLITAPTSVVGGFATDGSVSLRGPAGPQGAAVSVTSDSTSVVLPNVTIPAGKNSTTFAITTAPVSTAQQVTLTARYAGTSVTNKVLLSPAPLSRLIIQDEIKGGQSANLTIDLGGLAGPNGNSVTVSSSSSALPINSPVVVSAGRDMATMFLTSKNVAAATSVTLTATFNGVTKTATTTINPTASAVSSLTLSPTSVVEGSNVEALVRLNAIAPPGGAVVSFKSSSAAATVPASVTVPSGYKQTYFLVKTGKVTKATSVTITASFNSTAAKGSLTVDP